MILIIKNMKAGAAALALTALTAFFSGCAPREEGDPLDGLTVVTEDPTDLPLPGLTADEEAQFARGDAIFETLFRETQGLGPLYIRAGCASCHADDSKGPGFVTRMVVVEADGVTAAADQSLLPYGTVSRPYAIAGATLPILPPDDPSVKTSVRVGPAVFGRGWMEAVADQTLLDLEAEQAADGVVSGRANLLPGGQVGRFGVKARVYDLVDFAADAFRGDMGMTSPIFPDELPNPESVTDDAYAGIDVTQETVEDAGVYVRLLRIPRREGLTSSGESLFAETGCADCHTPSLPTREDFPVAALAGKDAEVFTDMLLHDMGAALADGLRDVDSSEREWKTPPLVGIRHLRNFLHDGRAADVEEAIAAHAAPGSEAADSVERFDALTASERETLLEYVNRL